MTSENTDRTLVLRNTLAFDPRHADAFKRAIVHAVAFAERHAPQRMVQTFLDEPRGLCYSLQVFDDSDAVRRHWQVSDPNIAEVMSHSTVRHLEVYGQPDDDLRQRLLDSLGEARVSFYAPLAGFLRRG